MDDQVIEPESGPRNASADGGLVLLGGQEHQAEVQEEVDDLGPGDEVAGGEVTQRLVDAEGQGLLVHGVHTCLLVHYSFGGWLFDEWCSGPTRRYRQRSAPRFGFRVTAVTSRFRRCPAGARSTPAWRT